MKKATLAESRNQLGSTSILNSTTNNTLKPQLPKLRETRISSRTIEAPSWALPSRLKEVYLYRSVTQPQVLYGAPLWGQKYIRSLQLFQNKILRSIFKNCLSPLLSTAEALTGSHQLTFSAKV